MSQTYAPDLQLHNVRDSVRLTPHSSVVPPVSWETSACQSLLLPRHGLICDAPLKQMPNTGSFPAFHTCVHKVHKFNSQMAYPPTSSFLLVQTKTKFKH